MHRDGVPDEDRKRLYQHARLGPPEMDAINNLPKLGQEVTKVGLDSIAACHPSKSLYTGHEKANQARLQTDVDRRCI